MLIRALTLRLNNQLDTLEHVILAGFTHEAVIELSERLSAKTASSTRPLFLRVRRCLGDRDRAEDEFSLLAQCRQAGEARIY